MAKGIWEDDEWNGMHARVNSKRKLIEIDLAKHLNLSIRCAIWPIRFVYFHARLTRTDTRRLSSVILSLCAESFYLASFRCFSFIIIIHFVCSLSQWLELVKIHIVFTFHREQPPTQTQAIAILIINILSKMRIKFVKLFGASILLSMSRSFEILISLTL